MYLTSKCGKVESTDFLNDVSEDGGDHGFGCDSNDDILEANTNDKAAENANELRLWSKAETQQQLHRDEYWENFVKLDLESLSKR